MPDVRYSVPGIPPQEAAGLTAFMPHFNRAAGSGAQAYKYNLSGFPGTKEIPAPTGNTQMFPDVGDLAQTGWHRSSDAPDVFYPQQYYERRPIEAPGAGMPILLVDPVNPGPASLLPVPAANPALIGRANQAMSPPTGVVQRIRQLPWFPRLYTAPGA